MNALVTAGVVLGVVLSGVAFLRWVLPLLRRIVHLVDDLAGQPARPGVAARPGVMERLERIESRQQQDGQIAARLDRIDSDLLQLRSDVGEATKDREALWDVIRNAQLAPPPIPE